MGADDEEVCDDVSLNLQMQQFLDEWHYRVLHSGLANNTDRHSCVLTALELFEMHGLGLSPADKSRYVSMSEPLMIEELVKRMDGSPELRKTFEHFALQLQLVVSATTRVRYALEEVNSATAAGDTVDEDIKKAEVAKVMDEGDSGISQQILKQAVLEAAVEVGELNELHSSWWKNTSDRLGRLKLCAEDADKAKAELEAVTAQLTSFGAEQNAKSKSVLMGMIGGNEKALKISTFRAWQDHFKQYVTDKEFHDKFRQQIEDAQKKLLDYKMANKDGVKGVLLRKAADGDKFLKEETIKTWKCYVKETKEERELEEEMAAAKAKLAQFHESQRAGSMKVMARMAGGKDSVLKTMCFQGWLKALSDMKAENALEEATKKAEAALAEHMSKKSAEAKQVIQRMLGSGEQGLLMHVRGVWNELYKAEKREMDKDEAVRNANKKFSEMSGRQKRIVKSVAERTNKKEEELCLNFIFQQWVTQARVDRVQRHYAQKMDNKKGQLEAVQSMFKSFATQLEQGISTTPRSQRKSNRSGSQTRGEAGSAARPPQIPATSYPQS